MFFIGVCEDDNRQRVLILEYLSKVINELKIKAKILEFSSGEELLNNYPCKIDILFLDIQMLELSGMDVARKIREFDKYVEILFTTAIQDYICEGYEVKAYRYLLKPLTYSNILKHTKSCINELTDKNSTIVLKDKFKTVVIKIDDILYIEVLRKEITVHMENKSYAFIMSMKSIEESLTKKNFFRCHKSYLINLKRVKGLIEKENVVFIDKFQVPVSRSNMKNLKFNIAHILGDVLN